MKKIITISIFLISILSANSIEEQEKMKNVLFKLVIPAMDLYKQGIECLSATSEDDYKECILKYSTIRSKDKVNIEKWKNKSERNKSLKKLKSLLNKSQKAVDCAKKPNTTDYLECGKYISK